MKKVLLSARDPGAALNILCIYKFLEKSSLFEPYLTASRPAFDLLKSFGVNPYPCFFENKSNDCFEENDDLTPLMEKTSHILNRFSPDAVISGLSSFGCGIGEALIYLSTVKTFCYQDFWGDLNPFFNKYADVILCLDDLAADVTNKRFGDLKFEVIGFPKLDLFKEIDIENIRHKFRSQIKADNDCSVISWFGQSPLIAGHDDVFESFLHSAKNTKGKNIFLIKGHPKFGKETENSFKNILNDDLKVLNISSYNDSLPWLLASDLAVTPFSLCGMDHAGLTYLSYKAIGSTLYLMNNNDIWSSYNTLTGLNFIPMAKKNMGFLEREKIDSFSCYLSKESKTQYFDSVKNSFYFFDKSKLELILQQEIN